MSGLSRVFIPGENILREKVIFPPSEAHYLVRVLRLQSGDKINVFDGSSWEYLVVLEKATAGEITGRILSKTKIDRDPSKKVILLPALLKSEKFDWVIQKSTELGVNRIIPLKTQRTVMHIDSTKIPGKVIRWQKIAQEAARQCGRTFIPEVLPPRALMDAFEIVKEINLAIIPWEGEEKVSLRDILTKNTAWEKIALFIGPEGGFTLEEMAKAQQAGLISVSLGSRILRAETAALAAVTAVLYAGGDLG